MAVYGNRNVILQKRPPGDHRGVYRKSGSRDLHLTHSFEGLRKRDRRAILCISKVRRLHAVFKGQLTVPATPHLQLQVNTHIEVAVAWHPNTLSTLSKVVECMVIVQRSRGGGGGCGETCPADERL